MPCSHQFVVVAEVLEGTSDSKAEKIEFERKLNDLTTPTTVTRWDRTSFDRLEISIQRFGF